MSTFLNDAKTFYEDFFYKHTWDETYADRILNEKEDLNERKQCMKEIYRLILDNTAISDEVKDWVKTNHSIQDTAKIKKVTVSSLKNQLYHANTTLGKELTYKNNNLIHWMLLVDEISSYDWENINKIIQTTIAKRRKHLYPNIFSMKNLLINIPRKEFCTSVTDEDFNSFLRLITPYFINERKRVQHRINEQYSKEAGYFNYLMTPGISLSNLDKSRLAKIKKLLDEETLNTFNKLNKDKLTDLKSIKEETKSEEKDYRKHYQKELAEGKYQEMKSTRVQFDI